MSFDFLIVGQGIAGSVLSQQLNERKKTFKVVDPGHESSASWAAVGLFNPIVLKRMTLVHLGKLFVDEALEFYSSCEEALNESYIDRRTIVRSLASQAEENEWMECLGNPKFDGFLNEEILRNSNALIKFQSLGEVIKSGRLDVRKFLRNIRHRLSVSGNLMPLFFDFKDVRRNSDGRYLYEGDSYEQIVLCNGVALRELGFDRIQPNKGEVMSVVFSERPSLDYIYKSEMFLSPFDAKCFAVGATYEREFEDAKPVKSGLEKLKKGLKKITDNKYEIVDHWAAVRPTSADRRPILGQLHPQHKIYVLNGLGSRGVLMAPFLSNHLLSFILDKQAIREELDVNRFQKSMIDIRDRISQIC